MSADTIPSFINKGQPEANWPAWLLTHTVGRPEPNGSFMIRTKVGKDELRARVYLGAIVFERDGIAYTRPDTASARAFIAGLEEAAKPDPKAESRERAPSMSKPAKRNAQQRIAATRPTTPSRKFDAPKGMPPSIEMRHPSELKIDDSYQRSIDTGPSRALINRIAARWDWRMCLPLVVSKRDDGFYVIDGQHRLAAALMRGDIPFLPCCAFVFASVAEEAEMFVAMNRSRRAINRLDDFHAAQVSGDPDALAIRVMIEAVGFTVSRKTGSAAWAPGEVAFTSAIAKARRRHGDVIARTALEIMADAFRDERLTVGSPVFTAICGVLGDSELKPERGRLAVAVKTFDMAGWQSLIAECKGGTDGWRASHS